jgi:hypothetical protein
MARGQTRRQARRGAPVRDARRAHAAGGWRAAPRRPCGVHRGPV